MRPELIILQADCDAFAACFANRQVKQQSVSRRGLTLLELLTVVGIILLLFLLILPVVQSARRRGHDATCISNMRQIVLAISMYRQDYSQEYPRRLRPVMSYLKSSEVLVCPADPTEKGMPEMMAEFERLPKLSYRYFAQYTDMDLFLQLIPSLDPNHGILACVVHPVSNLSYDYPPFAPHVRRGHVDGSVAIVRKRSPDPSELLPQHRDNPYSNGCLNGWLLYTNAPCPPEYCHQSTCHD